MQEELVKRFEDALCLFEREGYKRVAKESIEFIDLPSLMKPNKGRGVEIEREISKRQFGTFLGRRGNDICIIHVSLEWNIICHVVWFDHSQCRSATFVYTTEAHVLELLRSKFGISSLLFAVDTRLEYQTAVEAAVEAAVQAIDNYADAPF